MSGSSGLSCHIITKPLFRWQSPREDIELLELIIWVARAKKNWIANGVSDYRTKYILLDGAGGSDLLICDGWGCVGAIDSEYLIPFRGGRRGRVFQWWSIKQFRMIG
jgi:hypothetical protein